MHSVVGLELVFPKELFTYRVLPHDWNVTMQALRTCFVKTSEGIMQRVAPMGGEDELLSATSLPADAASGLDFSQGYCKLVEGDTSIWTGCNS